VLTFSSLISGFYAVVLNTLTPGAGWVYRNQCLLGRRPPVAIDIGRWPAVFKPQYFYPHEYQCAAWQRAGYSPAQQPDICSSSLRSPRVARVNWRGITLAGLFSVLAWVLAATVFMFKDRILGVHLYFIPSPSMLPALLPGDIILVDTWAYKNHEPQLDDIVIFTSDAHQGVLVKRIQPWPEGAASEGKYFVMGDNRNESLDSRYFGGISPEQISGQVKLIVFSVEPGFRLRKQRWLISPPQN
jgi:signal peptidase I